VGRYWKSLSCAAVAKCCLLETHIEQDKNIMVVPWGADLAMVEAALRKLSEEVEYA